MSRVDTISSRSPRRAWAPEASVETATVLRLLMVRPWLCAGRDDEAIAAVRRNLDAVRDAFARLGWVVVVERDLVRLRKTPPVRRCEYAESGPTPLTCQWFFLLVAAAESMGRHVALGTLVSAARAAAAEAQVATAGDIVERRAIVAALKMLDERGVVEELDGDLDGYVHDENARVLLAVHHTRLLHVIANFAPLDPVTDPAGWLDAVEREPDPARRMRRCLVDDTLVHTADLDLAEADWLSRRARGDDGGPLAAAFGLHLERRSEGAAFVVPDDGFRHPRELGPLAFPGGGTVAHAALLVCTWATSVGDEGDGPGPGWRTVAGADVAAKLTELAADEDSGSGGWKRELATDPAGRLLVEVLALLRGLDLVRVDAVHRGWSFSPAAARWESPATPARPRRRTHTQPDNAAFDFGVFDDPDLV